jgi:hypothetical protein
MDLLLIKYFAFQGGKYPRPVSRLSFRRKKFGIAGLQDGAFVGGSLDKQDLLNGNLDDTGEQIFHFQHRHLEFLSHLLNFYNIR